MGLEQRQESEGWLAPRLYEFPRHCSLPQTFRYHPTGPVFCSLSLPLPALTIPGLGKCVGNINFTHECIYIYSSRGRESVKGMERNIRNGYIRNIGTNFFLSFSSFSSDRFLFFYVNRERRKDSFLYFVKNAITLDTLKFERE